MNFNISSNSKGSAMAEIIIGSSIMLVGILAISVAFNTYLNYALTNQKNVESTYLMQEGLEAMSFLRDIGWTNNFGSLSTTTTYYLVWSGSRWATTTTEQYVDGSFLRSISVTDVKRDANSDIATSGTYDPDIKLVTVSVSYLLGQATTTKSMSRYIVNIR
ncbi:MAG: hypothetical protein WAW92_00165 [Minisyncoccia bacterium]